MRPWWVLPLCFMVGCASTVTRLDGNFETPTGPARTDCEQRDWLVVVPTRAELFDDRGRRANLRDDGFGLYRIGAARPASIPSLADELGSDSSSFARHGRAVRPHDTQRLIAGSLGVAGLVALTVGTALFVSAFDTERQGSEQTIDSTRAVLGSVLVGAGFGLGIGGLAVNPGQAERSRAEAARYVFLPPEDSRDQILRAVGQRNQRIRERCRTRPAR